MGMYYDIMKQVHDKAKSVEGLELPPKVWHAHRDKRRVGWFLWMLAFVGIILIGYSQRPDQVAVEVPVVDSLLIQRLQAERDQAMNDLQDYKRLAGQLQKIVKMSEVEIAKLNKRLDVLAASVPPQPVILEAVKREASTENGFNKLVARNFGADIAKRVKVTHD